MGCLKAEDGEVNDIWALLEGFVPEGGEDENQLPELSYDMEHHLGHGPSELRARGISSLCVSPDALNPLRGLAEAVLEPKVWTELLGTEPGHELDLGQGWPRLRLHCSLGSDKLLWLYACDEDAMGMFDVLATEVSAAVEAAAVEGSQPKLCAASLVVLRGPGAQDSEVHNHRDWETANLTLPPRTAFTVLVPLSLPAGAAGLEVFGEGGELRGVVRYELGGAVAFDNAQMHRTQPGRSPTRILASLSFAPTCSRYWPAVEQVLRGQTPHFYRSPSPE